MVPRIPVFFVILLTAESRPYYGMGGRRTSDSKKVWNFDGVNPAYYPLLPFPVQQSGMFSDFSSLPISQSSLQFSDMLNRVRKEKISSSEQEDFDQKTAQMVDQFGQRVRATVRQYEKAHDQGMQNVGKIMKQFNLDEVKDRLKKTLMDKKAFLKKLHSIGWRGKYIGVPYDTMNDDHRIVKKPGVYSISLSQPNAVLVAPAIQPISVQHPALPEVTTSVYFHQEPEPTATVDDYVHPTEVNETTEISNSIDDAEKLTIIDMTTSKETLNLEEDIREIPFSETNFSVSVDTSPETEDEKFYATLSTLTESSPRTQDESTTTEIGPTFPPTITIVDEENTSMEIEGYATATEIIPRYSPTFVTEGTLGTEGTSLPASETSAVPSSTTRNPGTSSHIISTFSSIFSTEEPVATSDGISAITNAKFDLVIHGEDREPTTYSPVISTESTSWPTRDSITPVEEVLSTIEYNTSPSFPDDVETSTGGSSTLLFSAIPTESTSDRIDGEKIAEIISTSTEESETLEGVTITTEPPYDPFVTDGETIAYSATTSTGNIPTETAFWQPISSEATKGVGSTSSFTIPSTEMSSMVTERLTTIDPGEATTVWEETSTTSSAIDLETTDATSTVLNPAVYDSRFEIGIRHLETSSTFPTTIASQATSIFEEIPTTKSSFYGSPTIDAGISTVLDDSTVSEGNYLTSPAIEVETTTVIDSKLFSTNPIESVTVGAGSSTTLDSGFDRSTIDTDSTTETASTLQSTISTEKTTSLEEIEDSYSGIPAIGVETTTEILLPFYHTIPKETTTAFDGLLTTTTESSIDHSMIDEETTETSSTLSVTVLTKATTNSNPEFDTLSDGLPRFVDYYPISSTTEVETNTVVDSTVYSTTPIELMMTGTESLTTAEAASESSTIAIESTTETRSTSQSTIPTDRTTILNGIPETGYSYFDLPTIEDETATEILSPFASTIPIEPTISTATEFQVDSLMTEGGASEITRPFPVTVTTVQTTTLGVEETPGLDGSTRFEGNYLQTSSSIEVETSTVRDSTFFSASESPAIDIKSTPETASTFQSPISTKKDTDLEDMPAITDSYSGIPTTIGVDTTIEILLPFSHTILTQSTTAFDQISTTTIETLIDNTIIDDGTTETISTLQNNATTALNQEITTLSDYLPRFMDNYLTNSTTEVGATTVVDSTFYFPSPTEPITMGTESLTTIDSSFESSTIDIESTTETPSTSQSSISTEKTTTSDEIPEITESSFGIPAIDEETTPEILLPFSYSNTVPIEPTLTIDELSTTTTESPIDSSIIDEETTEVMATFSAPSEPTTISAPEMTALPDILPRFVNNYSTSTKNYVESTTESVSTPFAKATTFEERTTTNSPFDSSTIYTGTYAQVMSSSHQVFTTSTESSITSLVTEEEITGEVYSIFSSAISTGIVQITTVNPKSESSTIDTESTSGIVPTISVEIPTEKTTTLEDIFATTGLPLESSTIYKETTTVIIPTDNETTTSFEDVPEATYMGTNGVTDDGETTTEIVSTVSPTFPTETSVEPASVYDFEARSDSGDLDESFTPVLPEFSRAAIEEPDVETLLNLIPLIIEELRKNNLSTAEVYTLRQIFGNIWPLLEEESKRKSGESVNHKLAILLYEAGQRLSNID